MILYMIQMQLDPAAFVRFLQGQGLNRREDEDLGYGLHVWLTALFGDLAPRPFRLYMRDNDPRPPKVLGYATHPHTVLVERAKSFAEPFGLGVCDLDRHIDSRKMPGQWSPGTRLGFEVIACPVGRKADSGIEKDVFLIQADNLGPDAGLQRESVYKEWFTSKVEPACKLEHTELAGFRLVHQARRSRQSRYKGPDRVARLTRPQVRITGVLIVDDSEAFSRIISRGIGRHRAFGYGMLLLRPV